MEPSLRNKLLIMGQRAHIASKTLAQTSKKEREEILLSIKEALREDMARILEANAVDMAAGEEAGLSDGLLDRLLLTEERILGMLTSIDDLLLLDDYLGKIDDIKTLENGLIIGKKRIPIGVLAMIYESRPNVTLDAAILAIKSGNAIILRGGKEAIHSILALGDAIHKGIRGAGFDENIVQVIDDSSRDSAIGLMQLTGFVDLLIPRGSERLIQSVVDNATVPVLETGVGNCHLYVDEYADLEMALRIFENGKTQRVGVCNALESLLVHRTIGSGFYEKLNAIIDTYNLTVYACERSIGLIPGAIEATEEDYGKEYLDYAFSIKMVDSIEDAIEHINRYSTGHSDAIITENMGHAQSFIDGVDSACVYVNASTRFTDGSQFGYGAEIGISTQKLHARGPVGIEQLSTYKYIILGQGQVRG